MPINDILAQERAIWGDEKLTLSQILVRLGVIYGDLCRWERNADRDQNSHTNEELQKELGNIITSTIRFCDDLGFDPVVCIERALRAQKKFVQENSSR